MLKTIISILSITLIITSACDQAPQGEDYFTLSKAELQDRIKGAWALQTIGVTYGGPTEFRYLKRVIPDSVELIWNDTTLQHYMEHRPGLYDDIYLDLTFVEVLEKEGVEAPAASFAKAYANADYRLWHANQQGRYNYLHGLEPPETGHWLNNPHADDIDFQIEADFAGIMNPGMPASAIEICDRVGHIMNSGDGYYGGVFVAGLYSYAFIETKVPAVIDKALALIPEASTFYQCIADVIDWHQQYPESWKQNWDLLEEKWGDDIGCPDGVLSDFNIDAKLNAAYVVLGLLYGEGEVGKSMEIATRAGQDSDCNPATAGGVLGAMIGFDQVPEYWKQGLDQIEAMNFAHTTTSLNKAYQLSYQHALDQITHHGGEVGENEVKIKKQKPSVVPLEQNFPGYVPDEKVTINKKISSDNPQEMEFDFSGIGVVLRGRTLHEELTPADSLEGFSLKVDFYIDGEKSKTMDLPIDWIRRAHELFYQYELPEGDHKLRMVILNPHEKVSLEVRDMISYGKKSS